MAVSRGLKLIAGLMIAAAAVVIAVVVYTVHVRTAPPPVARAPAPAASVEPADNVAIPMAAARPAHPRPRNPKPAESCYMDVVRRAYPSMPTTQPLAVPLDLSQAARFILKAPIYLDRTRGDLWITRQDAPPIAQVLRDAIDPDAADPQSHVLRQRVVFVHWMPAALGDAVPYLICRTAAGRYREIWAKGNRPLPVHAGYRWDHAFSWDRRVVVPSRTGISILTLGPDIRESYLDLATPGTATTRAADIGDVQALLDWRGLLAWIPWDHGKIGGRGAARYIDGKWMHLTPQQGWPERIVDLVPLRDGSVFQFVADDAGAVTVQTGSLDKPAVDEPAVRELVARLDDPDQQVRRKAVSDLANYGPGAWPLLQKLLPDQPPQARQLLRQLLKDRQRPTLSGMTLLGTRELRLAGRLSDGGVVFYAGQGVSVPEADGTQTITAPAWLSIRPGHYVELLPPAMTADLKPGQCKLDVVGDQWIVDSDVRGPRLFYGNGLAVLLRKNERQFTDVIGMDQLGRWLFRKPLAAGQAPADASEGDQAVGTLIIDPHLPDPTPRLPVWQLAIAQTVGWDKDNWPVIKNGAAYALGDSDWRGLDKDEQFFTRLDQMPAADLAHKSAASPTSRARTPQTAPTTEPSGELPILTAGDGTRYFGGLSDLRIVKPDGRQITWPLPAIANGAGPATLIRTDDGTLFLFNQPGRVLRIAPAPAGPEPFVLQATFTHNVPSAAHPTRIWLDPAGRIDIEWGSRLAICFPQGYIPRPILEKMVDQSGLDPEGP